MKIYKIVSLVTSFAFIYSFIQHFFNSGSIMDMGLQTSIATYFLARRMSVFPLGIAILLFLSRNLPHSIARQYICLSTGLLLTGYALIGSYELIVKTVNSIILIPIILEIVLGVSFLTIYFKNIKVKTVQ